MTPEEYKKLEGIMAEVLDEVVDATRKFDSFNSTHHGYAVILEELDELWDCIKDKRCPDESQREEAKQVAAMACRFMLDICDD